jgi:autotransporter-associated beta strand protein
MNIKKILSLVVLPACLAGAELCRAGSHTWSGALNSSWSNPGNWSAGGAPQLGETNLALIFPASAMRFTATNDAGNFAINTIQIQGNNYAIGGSGVTLVYNSVGASILCSGTNHVIALPITLNSAGLALTVGTTSELKLTGTLSGPGSFTKFGYGKLTLAGASDNTYAGLTKVLGGELHLNQGGAGNAIAIPGDLVLGNTGNQNAIYVYYQRDHQVADTATVRVNLNSYLGLYGHSDAIGQLVLDGGYVATYRINPLVTGLLTLLGNVSVLAGSQASSTIGGHLSLGGATRTFDVTNGVYLSLIGAVSDGAGPAGLLKAGAGTLTLAGSEANTYSGATTVSGGTLELNMSSTIAVPGSLVIGDDGNAPESQVVRFLSAGQLAVTAPVTIHSSGVLDLSAAASASPSVGSLTGSGLVKLGVNSLTVANNSDVQFGGKFTGTGSLIKQGTGKLILGGASDQFFGNTFVNAGTLHMQNWIPSSPVTVNVGGKLMGDGLVGNISSAAGMISPGCCPSLMKLGSKNLLLDAASVFRVQLDGTNSAAVKNSSQLAVTGTVSLGGATLQATLGFASAVSNKFTIIDNDGADVVTGTFKNLPEGATLVIGEAQFQITYHGGDGNDVVLTQLSAITPTEIADVQRLGNGSIQITATGLPNTAFTAQATDSLTPPVQWTNIGTATADAQGHLQFIDTDAPNHPIRFYRFRLP